MANENKAQKVYKIIMLVLITAFLTFMATSISMYSYFKNNEKTTTISISGDESIKPANTQTTSDIGQYFSKLKETIDKYFLWQDDIDETKLKNNALKGYVEGLGDAYTEFIPANEMKKFTENITGSFVGIGVYMTADKEADKIVVYYPLSGSPAEKAGIKSGDYIVEVDGIEYKYKDFDTIADKIKGEEGTTVKLVIERDKERINFEIKREKVEINPITSKIINNNIGYIKFQSFDEKSAENLRTKIDELISQGAKSLILDLRNNGGGIVNEATAIADYFLDKDKVIMTEKDKDNKEQIEKTKNDKQYDLPLVILVNKNSASATEILTGALKDNGRAKVIGNTTYGKGVIQTVIKLSDGSALKITTAEYYTPNGTAINKVGIKPDIEVTLTENKNSSSSVAASDEDDTQLKKAIEELSK